MQTVSVIYFSGSGHTTKLAEAVSQGAASVAGVKNNLIAINGDDIVKGRYQNDAVFAQLDASDAIIFGSPTYMAARRRSSRRSPMRPAANGMPARGATNWRPASPYPAGRAATS